MVLYALLSVTIVPGGTMNKIEEINLTEAECVRKAKYFIAELYDGAICRHQKPTDSKAVFTLPSGRVLKLERVKGAWIIPNDLLPSDRALVDEIVSPLQSN